MNQTPKRREAKGAGAQALLLFGAASPSDVPGRVTLVPYKPVVVDLARLDAVSPPWLRVRESKAVRGGQSLSSGYRRLFADFVAHLAFRATREAKLENLGTVIIEPLASSEPRERVGIVVCFRPDAPAEDFQKEGIDIKTAGASWCLAFRSEFTGALAGQRKTQAWRVWVEAAEGLTSAALRKAMDLQEREEDANLLAHWGPALEAERERAELASIKPKRAAKVPEPSAPLARPGKRI